MDKLHSCGMIIAILLFTVLFGFYKWSGNQIENMINKSDLNYNNIEDEFSLEKNVCKKN